MSEVKVIRDFSKRPSWFQVEGIEKHEKRSQKGDLIDGNHHRWVEKDALNYDTKKYMGYENATYDDIKVPYATKGRKKGEPWELSIGNEQFIYMKRSKEILDEEELWRQARGTNSAVAAASEFNSPGGTAVHKFEQHTGPMPQGMKFRPAKTGR